MLPHVAGGLLRSTRLGVMSENTGTTEPESHIDYVLQTPQTIEDATVPTSTIKQIAKLLGHDPNEVTSIELTPHQVTVLTVTKADGLLVRREGTKGTYEGRKHVRIVI